MLSELKDYLALRGWVSVGEVAAKFSVSPETARAMIEHWVRKGKVSRLERHCHSCALPCGKSLVVYQWLEQNSGRA